MQTIKKHNFSKIKKTPATLLVPKSLIKKLEKRLKKRKMNLNRYIRFLLENYGNSIKFLNQNQSPKIKKKYQDAGLKLQKRNFLPDNEVWQSLTEYARGLGVSRTLMFILLFLLESKGVNKSNFFYKRKGVPIKRRNRFIKFTEKMNLVRDFYKRILILSSD